METVFKLTVTDTPGVCWINEVILYKGRPLGKNDSNGLSTSLSI